MSELLDELLSYAGLDEAERGLLAGLHRDLAPELPGIAARFYATAARYPGAAAVLGGPQAVAQLTGSFVEWLASGLLGPYDDAFYAKRSRIGRRHVEIGLAQHYMFTGMTVVRAAYYDRIVARYPPGDALPRLLAVDKLLDIELALMLRHYQLDSEARLLAQERRIAGDQAQALQTLTAGLAHEVRNPLNAAKLQLELASRRLKRGAADPAVGAPVELAHDEIERLSGLLDEFLAFARPPQLALAEHDVVALAREVVDAERPLAARTGATLELVGSPAPALARVDARKLRQVLENLVRNALEATPRGHVTIAVVVADATVCLRVADNGPGIPEHVRRRVFEPFFSTKEGGTGMGMPIVQSLVRAHGGVVDIASSARGTAVDVTLPRN